MIRDYLVLLSKGRRAGIQWTSIINVEIYENPLVTRLQHERVLSLAAQIPGMGRHGTGRTACMPPRLDKGISLGGGGQSRVSLFLLILCRSSVWWSISPLVVNLLVNEEHSLISLFHLAAASLLQETCSEL